MGTDTKCFGSTGGGLESLACERLTGSVTIKKTSNNERGGNRGREKETNK